MHNIILLSLFSSKGVRVALRSGLDRGLDGSLERSLQGQRLRSLSISSGLLGEGRLLWEDRLLREGRGELRSLEWSLGVSLNTRYIRAFEKQLTPPIGAPPPQPPPICYLLLFALIATYRMEREEEHSRTGQEED